MNGMMLVSALGGSDCERIGSGWLAQPTNAVSSLAYVVVGAWLLHRATRSPADQVLLVAAGIALAAIGIGSVAYHGPQPSSAGLLHDGSIVSLLAVLVVRNAWLLARRHAGLGLAYAAPCAVVAPGLSAIGQDRIIPVVLVVAVAAGAAVVHRTLAAGGAQAAGAARFWWTGGALMAAALAIYALGRTVSPLCRPDGPWQLHALWHVVSAVGLGVAVLAFAAQTPRALGVVAPRFQSHRRAKERT